MGFDDILKKLLKGAAKGAFAKEHRKRRRPSWEEQVASRVISAVDAYVAGQTSARQTPPPAPPMPPAASTVASVPPPLPQQASHPADARALTIMRAMVAAANADHEIDEHERRRIFEKAEFMGLSDSDRRLVHAEFERPHSVAAIAREVGGDAALSRQVYLAALLVVDLDTQCERMFLTRLAIALGLPPSEVQELHEQGEL